MIETRGDVLVDMDGVMASFDGRVEALLADRHQDIPILSPRTEFYLHDDYPEEQHAVIKSIWRAKGFYRELEVIEGVIEGWQTILDANFTPRVCSSPIPQNPDCVAEKQDWLEEYIVPYFGHRVIDLAIFDRHKEGYDAVALIDDKPVIPEAEAATWQHIIFDAPYNRFTQTYYRLMGWSDPNLPALLDSAAS